MSDLPRVIADGPLAENIEELLGGKVQLLPWETFDSTLGEPVDGVYTYGHLSVTGEMVDRIGGVRVISNYGVGVDHICLPDAEARGIPVGNTPEILNGATADMAFALLLATARRLVEGDHYARGPEFTRYDPGYMLGLEVHSTTIGIVGLGRIGLQIAQRARGFDMSVLYHNRSPRSDLDPNLNATYVDFDELLARSDYVVLSTPLTEQTTGLIGDREFGLMKTSAIVINVARGPVIDTNALVRALSDRQIYGAGLDVTDPEPLPRDHPLLALDNLVIAPHLGSATEQTRQRMAEISVENLLLGLRGEPLQHRVV